jgi:hypothetical protein
LGDNSKISISVKHWALDITLNTAIGHYHGATGLCFGTHDKIPAEKNMLDGNLVIPDFKAMKRGRKCPKSVDICLPEQPYSPKIPPGCTLVTDVNNYDRNTVVTKPNTVFKPIPYEEALARCRQVMGVDTVLSSIHNFLIESCATDLATTGYYQIAEDTRTSNRELERVILEEEKDSFDPEIKDTAKHYEETLGFGEYSCGNDCGGDERGTCTMSGCVCNTGFGGDQCAIDIGPVSLGQYEISTDNVHVNGSSVDNTVNGSSVDNTVISTVIKSDDGLQAVRSSANSRGTVFIAGFICGGWFLFL